MPEKEHYIGGGAGTLALSLFIGAVAFFVYGSTVSGFLYGIIADWLFTFASIVGLVPVAGPFLYWYWLAPVVQGWGTGLTHLPVTWLITDLQYLYLAVSIFFTGVSAVLIWAWYSDR